MPLTTLEDLLVHELRDLLNAEKQLLKALPRMAKAATRASSTPILGFEWAVGPELLAVLLICFLPPRRSRVVLVKKPSRLLPPRCPCGHRG